MIAMIESPIATPALQLWCVREDLANDPKGTLAAVRAAGFIEVEPFSADDFPGLGDAIRSVGLRVTSVHEHLIDVDVNCALDVAQSLGASMVIESWTEPERWRSKSSVSELAHTLNAAARVAAERGLRVSYHNHDHEFARGHDGEPLYFGFAEHLSPDVHLQLDIGTVTLAGVDPVSVLDRLGHRIESVHVLGEVDAVSQVLENPRGAIATHIRAIPPHARVILELEDGPFSNVTRALAAIDIIGAQS